MPHSVTYALAVIQTFVLVIYHKQYPHYLYWKRHTTASVASSTSSMDIVCDRGHVKEACDKQLYLRMDIVRFIPKPFYYPVFDHLSSIICKQSKLGGGKKTWELFTTWQCC